MGDGVSEPLIVTENPFGPPGAAGGITGSAEGEHAYAKSGSYTGQVCVMDDEGAQVCQGFSIDITSVANASTLYCQLRVDDLVDDGTTGEAHVEAVVTGSTQPLNFNWLATADGIEIEDPTSQTTTVRFTAALNRSSPFLLGFNIAAMNPNGEAVYCQAACSSGGPSGTLLGQCVSQPEQSSSATAPALSPLGLLLEPLLLMLLATKGLAARSRRR